MARKKRAKTPRDLTIDVIDRWMSNNARALSIDTLLTRPLEAMRMALEAGITTGEIDPKAGNALKRALMISDKNGGAIIDQAYDILRIAMTARKAGKLKRAKK